MDIEQMHVIERECAKVLMQCRGLADQKEYEKSAALFTPGFVFNSTGRDPVVGREANIASMNTTIGDLFMRCVISNILVTVIDADHAESTSYWIMYRHKQTDVDAGKVTTAEPTRFCESDDKFVRTEEGWRIAHREFKTVLKSW